MRTLSYADRPHYLELAAMVLVGLTHIALEAMLSEAVALWFSGGAGVVWLLYLAWRAQGGAAVLRAWGMRRDNVGAGLRVQLPFVACGAVGMLVYGATVGTALFSHGFWLVLVLYPLWGTVQQFALQNLIARNVAGLVSHPTAVAVIAAALFAASHIPRWPLVALTLVSGYFFTLAYRRAPNLWAVGLMHGFLGALAVYLVLEEDPGAAIWAVVTGGLGARP